MKRIIALAAALVALGAGSTALASTESNNIKFLFPQTDSAQHVTISGGKVEYADAKSFSSWVTEIDTSSPSSTRDNVSLESRGVTDCWRIELDINGNWVENPSALDNAATEDAKPGSTIVVTAYIAPGSNGEIDSKLTYTNKQGDTITDDMGELFGPNDLPG